MILEYGENVLDLDALNDYEPMGCGACCRIFPAAESLDKIPAKRAGEAFATDSGAVYFTDTAFKMLFDLAVRARLESVRYILKEGDRSGKLHDDGRYVLKIPDVRNALGSTLAQLRVRHVELPDDSRIVPHNLKALSDYDMVSAMCMPSKRFGKEYNIACIKLLSYIGDDIYFGRGMRSFAKLHKALSELFMTLDTPAFISFVNGYYELLDAIPFGSYSEKKDNNIDLGADAPVIPESDPDPENDGKDDTAGDESGNSGDNIADTAGAMPKATEERLEELFGYRLRKMNASDITGIDETYAAGYCEAFYDKELEDADSQGFLEMCIAARANGGAAPIDLLSEALDREHAKTNPSNILRRAMGDMRVDIEKAAAMGENLPDPEQIAQGDADDAFGEAAGQ